MDDLTDFTQTAADFAANLKSDGTADAKAADSYTAAEYGSIGGGEAATLPVEAIDDEVDPADGNDTDAHDTAAPQDLAEHAHGATSSVEEAAVDDLADNESDSDRPPIVSGQQDAAEPVTTARIDSDIFRGFPAAPRQPGEFQLPLCNLVIGKTSDGGVYDFDAGAAESLRHAVKIPEAIAPIVVTKSGNAWHVTDGWARVEAFRAQFGNTANVMVRVIEWDGTRDEALYNRFAATFLTLKSRKIDKSILLCQFHLAWSVPQLVLAARIGWTESRVTRELAAAVAMLEAPRFAELHAKAGDPPIDYLYKVQQARDAAAADDAGHPKRAPEKGAVAKLDVKLEALLAKPERFGTAEALAKLGIGKPDKTRGKAPKGESTDPTVAVPTAVSAPEIIDCVEDSSGDAVAMIETGADQFHGIRLLVDTNTLDDRRKAEVRHLIHEAIDRLLGF